MDEIVKKDEQGLATFDAELAQYAKEAAAARASAQPEEAAEPPEPKTAVSLPAALKPASSSACIRARASVLKPSSPALPKRPALTEPQILAAGSARFSMPQTARL